MKKILLGTTAIVALATMSSEAFAADKIKLELGGFMRHYVGVINHDEVGPANTNVARGVSLAQWSNSEIYFRGATTLDNGLNVSVDTQMESSTRTVGNRNFDIASLTVSSDAMGALTIGSSNHGVDQFATRAPMASNYDWGDAASLGMVAKTAAAASSNFTYAAGDLTALGGKGESLKYVSPNFSGAQVFASYSAGTGTTGNNVQVTSAVDDSYSYGVAYSGEMGGATIAADLAHAMVDAGYDLNRAGLNVGMAGFTVGGSYTDFNDTTTANTQTTATTSDQNGNAWELGVSYVTGPYSVSVDYMTAKNDGDTAVAGSNKDTAWQVAGTYDLGAGVALTGTYFTSKANGEGAAANTDRKASGVLAGIEVGF